MTQWKWIEEPKRLELPFRVYAVPDVGPIQLVAACEKQVYAEQIVEAHETKRVDR